MACNCNFDSCQQFCTIQTCKSLVVTNSYFLLLLPAVGCMCLPQPSDGFKWTHRLLQTNPKMQDVINTLLELAYLPPHTSLHAGKVTISCGNECTHDLAASGRTSSLLLMTAQQQLEAARFRNQVGCNWVDWS